MQSFRRLLSTKGGTGAAPDGLIRLNKLLSQLGICSRREADKYIADDSIKIKGEMAKLGQSANYMPMAFVVQFVSFTLV